MTFKLSASSQIKLSLVHPDLQKVVEAAIRATTVEFIVTEGIRTLARQEELLKARATTTMNSRHLGGFAVDVAAIVNGKADWHPQLYHYIADAFLAEAAKLNIPIVWGGNWRTFHDLCHFELSNKFYRDTII